MSNHSRDIRQERKLVRNLKQASLSKSLRNEFFVRELAQSSKFIGETHAPQAIRGQRS